MHCRLLNKAAEPPEPGALASACDSPLQSQVVAGARHVGKRTLVLQALQKLEEELSGNTMAHALLQMAQVSNPGMAKHTKGSGKQAGQSGGRLCTGVDEIQKLSDWIGEVKDWVGQGVGQLQAWQRP